MSTADAGASPTDRAKASSDSLRARPAGFARDVASIAGRALRGVPRDLEAVTPPIFIALFFFIVNIATLERVTQSGASGFDYTAFQMPTAILLGVTGVSRAPALVLDVQAARMAAAVAPVSTMSSTMSTWRPARGILPVPERVSSPALVPAP